MQVGAGRTADVRAEVGAPGPLWGGEGRAAADWRRGSVRQRAALSWLLPNRSPICPHSLFRSLTATDRPGSRVTPRGVAAAGEGRAAGLGAEEIECTLPSICCSIPPQAQIEAHTLEECQQLERGVLRALEAAAHLQLAHEAEVAARKQGAAPGGAAQQQQPGCEATAAAAAAAAVAAGKEEAEGEEGGGKKDSKKAKDKSVALAVAAWAKAETGDEPPAVQQVCGGGAWAGLSAVGSSQSVEAQRRGAPPRCTLLLATAPYHMPRRCTVPPHLPSRPPPPPPLPTLSAAACAGPAHQAVHRLAGRHARPQPALPEAAQGPGGVGGGGRRRAGAQPRRRPRAALVRVWLLAGRRSRGQSLAPWSGRCAARPSLHARLCPACMRRLPPAVFVTEAPVT